MELVRQFNAELSSIYEGKPPISKAKMGAITRYAVKALKYYKHVVHSVEKFIQKCHTEYKVPALYVLDSIIRQSRHQFGPEKDLFGPRFQKNIKLLFQYIYLCPAEDKPKIVRVLNLWQKNGIYTPEVISPLIDMASASQKSLQAAISKHKKAKAAAQSKSAFDNDGPIDALVFDEEERVSRHSHKKRKGISVSQDDEIKVLKAQLEQQKKQQELLQQQLQMQMMQTKQQSIQLQLQQQEQLRNKLQDQIGPGSAADVVDPGVNIMSQIQDLQKQLERDKIDLASLAANNNQDQEPVQHHPEQGHSGNTNENTTQFLENFQQLIQNAKGIVGNSSKDPRHHGIENLHQEAYDYNDGQDQRNSSFQAAQSPERRRAHRDNFSNNNNNDGALHEAISQNPYHNHNVPPLPQKKPLLDWEEEKNNMGQHLDDDAMQIDNDDYEPPFHDVLQQHQLEQQREDPRVHNQNQTESVEAFEERKQQQKEIEKKQRDKRLLPSPRHRRVTVASVTVWVGRLPKSFNSDILKSHFHEYAEVKHIDYIESRGCAFVTMASRFDADSALRFLRHKRIENIDVKLNWGKTKVLFDYSQFWEENVGCAFIPWEMMNEQVLSTFLDTCIIDEDTVPPGMSIAPPKKEEENQNVGNEDQTFQTAPPAFIPGFPPGIFPPAGLIPPIPPPGFRGQMPPIPPGIIPPNILQFNLNRPPGQNLSEGGVVVQEPRFEGRQEQPPLSFNNLQQQQPRPPLMPNQHPPFNNRDDNHNHQPRPSLLRPPFHREEQPHPQIEQQPAFNRDEPPRHINPPFPMNRPPPRHEVRLEEQQRPPFDGRVATGNLRFQLQSQPRFQLPSHQPQLEVRSQHGIPTIGFKQDERKEEKREAEKPWEKTLNTSNIPTTSFLLNLVNQQKEKQEEERKNERTDRSHCDKSPERDDDRDRRGRDRYDRRDRDRDRSDYRKRDRSYERGRRSRDRDRDDKRSDRERERERSGDRRNNRDCSSERRTERDRRDRYGRDRDEDRYRGNDRSNERNVDRNRERSRDRSRERSKQTDASSQDKQSSKAETETEQIEHLKKENDKDSTGMDRNDMDQHKPKEEPSDKKVDSSPQVEKQSTPPNEDDLYDPMEAMNSPEEKMQTGGEPTLENSGNEKPLQTTTETSPQKDVPRTDEQHVDFHEEEITEEPSESPIFPIANNAEDDDVANIQEAKSDNNHAEEIPTENIHAEEKSKENEVTAN